MNDKYYHVTDEELVQLVMEGNKEALTSLINRHKDFIYNIAVRMTGNTYDADDVTQEIMIKVVTKLSTFKFQSSFKTWLYRITVNHCLNLAKLSKERIFNSFENHKQLLENLPDNELSIKYSAESNLLTEEIKIECMLGTLLCLSREQRIIFILGAILRIDSKSGSEILETTEENYRKRLSRTRKDLQNYMSGQCSLMDEKRKCKCSKKARAAIEAGFINPKKLQFSKKHMKKVKDIVSKNTSKIDDILELLSEKLYREHPYLIFENNLLKPLIDITI